MPTATFLDLQWGGIFTCGRRAGSHPPLRDVRVLCTILPVPYANQRKKSLGLDLMNGLARPFFDCAIPNPAAHGHEDLYIRAGAGADAYELINRFRRCVCIITKVCFDSRSNCAQGCLCRGLALTRRGALAGECVCICMRLLCYALDLSDNDNGSRRNTNSLAFEVRLPAVLCTIYEGNHWVWIVRVACLALEMLMLGAIIANL